MHNRTVKRCRNKHTLRPHDKSHVLRASLLIIIIITIEILLHTHWTNKIRRINSISLVVIDSHCFVWCNNVPGRWAQKRRKARKLYFGYCHRINREAVSLFEKPPEKCIAVCMCVSTINSTVHEISGTAPNSYFRYIYDAMINANWVCGFWVGCERRRTIILLNLRNILMHSMQAKTRIRSMDSIAFYQANVLWMLIYTPKPFSAGNDYYCCHVWIHLVNSLSIYRMRNSEIFVITHLCEWARFHLIL